MRKLILVLSTVLLTIPQMRSYDFEHDGIAYNIIGANKVEVTCLPDGKKYSGNISIPDVVVFNDGPDMPSAESANCNSQNEDEPSGERIIYGVARIGDSAFKDCAELRKLEMPTVIEEIGVRAIAGCTGLIEITMPRALTFIDDEAFMGSSFKTMYIAAGLQKIGNRVFYGVTADDIMLDSCELIEFGEDTFTNSSIRRITLPKGLKSIPENTFKGCSNLVFVQFNESLEEIGKQAFSDCVSLNALSMPQGVGIIDDTAFSGTAINAISFSASAAPEYSCQSILGENIPSVIAIPSEGMSAFKEWCPQLTDGKVKIHLDKEDYGDLFWACTGEFNEENVNSLIAEGVSGDYYGATDIFINKGEDLSIALPLLCAGGDKGGITNCEGVETKDVFPHLDFFYISSNQTSFLISILLLEFRDVIKDCEITLQFQGSEVDIINEESAGIRFMPAEKTVASDNEVIRVFDSAGKLILSGFSTLHVGNLPSGLYMVTTPTQSMKIMLR